MTEQLLTVESHSTSVAARDFFNACWAVAYQVAFHYNRSAWVTDGHAAAGRVVRLGAGVAPPAGAWNLIVMDTSSEAGTLGYHSDEEGSAIPYSDVFAKTAVEDGASLGEVLSHEALEMLVDPHVESPRTAAQPDGTRIVVEVADPLEGESYDVGEPEGRVCGVQVAAFALPAYYAAPAAAGPVSFPDRGLQPFGLPPSGYKTLWPSGEQVFGERRRVLPAWASRLPRIAGA
jgi:hypothetical protein